MEPQDGGSLSLHKTPLKYLNDPELYMGGKSKAAASRQIFQLLPIFRLLPIREEPAWNLYIAR